MRTKTLPGWFGRCALMVTAALVMVTAACGDDPTGPVAFQKAAYLRSEAAGPPWNQATNEAAMDSAFGAGQWDNLRFETVNVASLANLYTFLFIEGGDDNAIELEAFLTANGAALSSFVNGGRRVLINSAPNEGDGMSFGFGVTLAFDDEGATATSTVEAVSATHPVFVATITTAFTGGGFGHALVSGTGLTAIIQRTGTPADVVLAEATFGRGRALFGGMTTDNFHGPQPAAHVLRINILLYAAGLLP